MSNTFTNHKGIKGASIPATGQTMYKDTECKGLYLRVYSNGRKAFVHRYWINGKERLVTLEGLELTPKSTEAEMAKAMAQARATVATQKEQAKGGTDPAIERDLKAHHIRTMPTLAEFADTYIERHAKPNKKSWMNDRRMLDADILPALGSLPLDKVERKHMIAMLDKKQEAGAVVMRNRLISLLSMLFNFAIDRDIIDRNPAAGIKKAATKARERVLTDDEIKALWERTSETGALSVSTRLALRFVLVTGQRPGEVCKMQQSEIQGDLWTMADTKNGRSHTVPLSPMALEIIREALPHSRNGVVFPSGKGGVMLVNVLDRVMSRHDWGTDDKPTPHDLRRTCITGLGALGFNRFVQNLVANHADNTIGGIYDRHDYAKEKRQALEAWERRLAEIVTGEAVGGNVVEFRRAV